MNAPEIWEPLDSQNNEIRLLLLRANADFDAWPQGRLIKQSLNYPTHYEALSYAWGGSQASMPLFLEAYNGVIDHPITADLCSALQHLRDPHEDKCFWLDAVCISQCDTSEKEQQIGLMHRIFHRANLVHIWLVPIDPSQPGTIESLRRMAQDTADHFEWGRDSKDIAEIESIDNVRYWSRQWVWSEMILARELLVHCGSATIRIEELKKALIRIGILMPKRREKAVVRDFLPS
jgi:hypothetical protein